MMSRKPTREEVIYLMENSRSLEEWDTNCDTVKATFGNEYPSYWFEAILESGVAKRTLEKLGADDKLRIISL